MEDKVDLINSFASRFVGEIRFEQFCQSVKKK